MVAFISSQEACRDELLKLELALPWAEDKLSVILCSMMQ